MKSLEKLNKVHNISFEREIKRLQIKDIERLVNKSKYFILTACPACNSNMSELAYDLYGLSYRKCLLCDTIYLSPCPTTEIIKWYLDTSDSIRHWRENMPPDTIRSRKATLYKERVDYIIHQINNYKIDAISLLDIGGGNGEFVEEMYRRNVFKKLVIVDPQPININNSNIKVIESIIEDYNTSESFSIITNYEVLEHLVDPTHFLNKTLKLLNNDGLFIFSTPNALGYETKVLGLLSDAFWFDHIRLYNPKSIQILLDKLGYKVLKIHTPGEFDVAIIYRMFANKDILLDNNISLKFLLEKRTDLIGSFQCYLNDRNMSSHMRIIAKKKNI